MVSKNISSMIAACMIMSLFLSVSAAPATSTVNWLMQPQISAAPGRSVSGKTLTVCKGDSVRFYWGSVHGVAQTTKANWSSCSLKKFKNLISVAAAADKTLKMTIPGTRYIYCQVPGHCSQGQKMIIVTKPTAC